MPPEITLRPIRDEDLAFLSRLYASTREEELARVPWTEEQKRAFLDQQFHAQHWYYQDQFPDARFDLVLREDRPVGRLYVRRQPDEMRVIDIALLPDQRGRGLGSALMRALLDEAGAAGCPVRIHVEGFNPAMRLYERLGFRKVEDQGVYWLMEWTGR